MFTDALPRRDMLKKLGILTVGSVLFSRTRTAHSQESPDSPLETQWRVNTPEDVRNLLAAPAFLEQIVVGQYNQAQYERGIPDFYKNNACHMSVLLMVQRFCELLKFGRVDEDTIGTVLQKFIGKTYSTSSGEHLYIHDSFGTMYALGLLRAFQETDPAQELYHVIESPDMPLSSPDDEGTDYLDLEHIQPLLDFGQTVFSQGGLLVVLGLNYGQSGTGSGGHFALVSSLHRDAASTQINATIIDPMFQGQVLQDVPWTQFWENSWDGEIHSPIMGVFGVVPNLRAHSEP